MDITFAQIEDIPEIMRVYDSARKFMRASGNMKQWINGYPQEALLQDDIRKKQLYVMRYDGRICGVFAFIIGADITYAHIEDGSWLCDSEYGTIHRIGGDGSHNGILSGAVSFCEARIRHLRIDTHEDNLPMQRAVLRNGFERRGIIYISDGTPRIAYEKI